MLPNLSVDKPVSAVVTDGDGKAKPSRKKRQRAKKMQGKVADGAIEMKEADQIHAVKGAAALSERANEFLKDGAGGHGLHNGDKGGQRETEEERGQRVAKEKMEVSRDIEHGKGRK